MIATNAARQSAHGHDVSISDPQGLKMSLLAVGVGLAIVFQNALRRNTHNLERSLATKGLAILTLLVWCGIIILGRLIAYDTIWGRWSLNPRV